MSVDGTVNMRGRVLMDLDLNLLIDARVYEG